MKCANCGMENIEGRKFCGECGAALEALPVQLVTPPIQQTSPPVAAAPRVSFPLSERAKKRLMVGAIAIAVILVVGTVLGYLYYYQPVRGSGSVSTTTIDAGQTVEFSYIPIQGVSPYQYS